MAKKKKSREMADGIMEGVREIQSWFQKGWTVQDVRRHYRQHYPNRIHTVHVQERRASAQGEATR